MLAGKLFAGLNQNSKPCTKKQFRVYPLSSYVLCAAFVSLSMVNSTLASLSQTANKSLTVFICCASVTINRRPTRTQRTLYSGPEHAKQMQNQNNRQVCKDIFPRPILIPPQSQTRAKPTENMRLIHINLMPANKAKTAQADSATLQSITTTTPNSP